MFHRVIKSALLGAVLLLSSHIAFAQTPPSYGAYAPVSPTGIATPVAMAIPSIDAYMPIIKVGLTKTGNLDTPHDFVQAGWYEYGPLPGQLGSSVIDGHVDNGGYHPTVNGVFKHLSSVQPGDQIYVTMSDGSVRRFRVVGSAVYETDRFPSDFVFNEEGASYLKIITCHGAWVPSWGTYSQRLVVTAVFEP